MLKRVHTFGLCAVLALAVASDALAQGTKFTFQGYLRQNNSPVNTTLSMTFTLFNHPTNTGAGAQVGSPITIPNVSVQNGLFTVELDFGNVWDGSDRWLQIQVGAQVLSPRVKINPAPYAIRAAAANPIGAAGGDLSGTYPNPTVARLQGRPVAATAPTAGQVLKWDGSQWAPASDLQGDTLWQASGSNIFYNAGNVGIGVSNPSHRLHVETGSGERAIFGHHTATTGPNYGVYGRSDSVAGRGVYGLAYASVGVNYGVYGQSNSVAGRGVYGYASANTGPNYGVYGESESPDGTGVYGYASATTGRTYGVYGRSDSVAGRGVYGYASANTGPNYGVYGRSESPDGTGVYGLAYARVGVNYGVYGQSNSVAGTGVYGLATADVGTTSGVYGESNSTEGRGVFGYASTTTGRTYGVYGRSESFDGTGVYGLAYADVGVNYGVYGETRSPGGYGGYFVGRGYFQYNSTLNYATLRLHETEADFVRLEFSNTNAGRRWHIAGFIGTAVGADRLNLWNSQTGDIVSLSGDGSVAVGTPLLYSARLNVTANSTIDRATLRLHETENDVARLEFTNTNTARKWHIAGLIGTGGAETDRLSIWNSSSGDLLWIAGNGNVGIGTITPAHRLHVVTSATSRAIYGVQTATTGITYGVYGESASSEGTSVYGLAAATAGAAWGVWGQTASRASTAYGVVGSEPLAFGDDGSRGPGHAVYGFGSIAATGTKSFQIDHPLRPETHYLNHFCAEGPEPYNIYSGVVVLDARGEAWVQLPDYFEAINRDPRYTLTPIGAPMPNLHIAVKIQNNRFKIAGGVPGMEVSWEVKAIRNDLWIRRYGYETEQEKEDEIKGKYLHPELYGQPKERGILYRPEPAAQPNPSGKR